MQTQIEDFKIHGSRGGKIAAHNMTRKQRIRRARLAARARWSHKENKK